MIEIHGLQKIIGQRTALDIPRLAVEAGEITAVIGAVGGGIEILFDLVSGGAIPSAGTISLAGASPQDKASFCQNVGVLFADDGLYQRRSPLQNLALYCQLYGLPHKRAEETLAQVGLADQANTPLDKLPGGMHRRLAFGRTLLHQPQVLLLFDPFDRCDEMTIQLISERILGHAEAGNCTLILAYDQANLDDLASPIYQLNQGRLSELPEKEAERASALPFKIPVRLEERVVLLNPADVLFAEAVSGASVLHTPEGQFSTQFTLNELEQRLERSGFFRTHRSFLVNLQHVREVIPYTRNSFSLRLDDASNTEIPLSKSAASELRNLLGY